MRLTKAPYLIAVLSLASFVPIQPLRAQIPVEGTMAIVGATLIDGTGAAPQADAVVVVEDGRIVDVGPRRQIAIPEHARVVDAEGKWLTPGFIDTHAHATLGPVELDMSGDVPAMSLAYDPGIPLQTLRTLLAHGVTSMRDPGGSPEQLVALRTAVETGALVGPRMRVAGMVIDRTPFDGLVNQVNSDEEVRAAVRNDAALGVDMVKLYVALTPDLMEAAIDEAHAAGIEAVAHLMFTTWTQAAEMGLDHIVHIVPGSAELLPTESQGAYTEMMKRGTQFMYGWFEYVDFDGPQITEMIAALVENDVSVDPTLVIFEGMVRGDDPFYTESPALSMAAPSLVENWRAFFNFNAGWTPADFASARAAWPKFLELTRRLYEAGVTLTAGTDANNPWIVPGHSYLRELQLLVDAGISPLEVIKIATNNGAKVLGLLEEVGTVQTGKWADLVLLGSDPLVEIGNASDIEWVMQAGRLHDVTQLRAGLR